MSTEKSASLLARIKAEFKSLLGIALYFWVLFALFAFHKAILYGEHNIFLQLGIALINSKLMAKVVFIGEHTRLSKRFEEKPLVYTILFKSFIFAILLFIFRVIEEILIGLWHGRSAYEALIIDHPRFGDGNATYVIAMACAIIFVALIPFFAYLEFEHALGADTIRDLLFKKTLADFKNNRDATSVSANIKYGISSELISPLKDDDEYWYLDQSENIFGPISKIECQRALTDGKIDCSTMIWTKAYGGNWLPLRNSLIISDPSPGNAF
jgi:hypothetical protein